MASAIVRVFFVLALALMVGVINLNSGRVAAQPVILPPDPALAPGIETVPDDPELDTMRWKLAIGGGITSIGQVTAATPKLQLALWGKLTQHFGLEGNLGFGITSFDFANNGKSTTTIVSTGLIELGYRTWGDEFQVMVGLGFDDMRDTTNAVGVTSLTGTIAVRWQPFSAFGFEARYIGGPGWAASPNALYRQEILLLGYGAF